VRDHLLVDNNQETVLTGQIDAVQSAQGGNEYETQGGMASGFFVAAAEYSYG
jgi:hypothetical protein